MMGVCRKREREGLHDFEPLEDKAGHSPGLNDGAATACPAGM